jgi:hypothetical protein
MSYPLYSFREVFLPNTSGGVMSFVSSGVTTDTLTSGQTGLFSYSHGVIGSSINAATAGSAILAVGSYHTVDNISPTMGGYYESDKSKPIKWANVTRFWKKTAVQPANMVISVGWDQTTTGATSTVGPTFQCGKFYRLLVEAKGSPALRTLAHELYRDLEAWTGCCAGNCQSGCTGALVDPVTVFLQWSDYIKQDPILKYFFAPAVYWNNSGTKTQAYSAYDNSLNSSNAIYTPNTSNPGSVVACIQLTAAYVDTVFGNCTFTPSDHYEIEPILIYASLRMDDGSDADPCQVVTTLNTSVPNMVKTITQPAQASGVGETVVREWIDFRRKKQEPFADGWEIDLYRMRETENDVTLRIVNRFAFYDEIHILHQVDYKFNPTSIVDQPMYEEVIYLPTGTTSTTFTNLVSGCLTAANNSVTLETF